MKIFLSGSSSLFPSRQYSLYTLSHCYSEWTHLSSQHTPTGARNTYEIVNKKICKKVFGNTSNVLVLMLFLDPNSALAWANLHGLFQCQFILWF